MTWQDRVIATRTFHKGKLIEHKGNWRIQDTAKELERSLGRISEDIQIANWMDKDPKVKTFKKFIDALDYVKKKKRELEMSV